MLNDFLDLIFPRLCCACNQVLLKNEKVICVACIINLPKTNFHLDKDNSINKIFWGRVRIEMAASFYFFSKQSKVQNLLHNLKYKSIKEIGIVVGKLYGYELKQSEHFKDVDCIIPVPLHKNKLKKRGYNQSEYFAIGISMTMGIPVKSDFLYRKIDSKTQTKKGRFKRWENVEDIFGVYPSNIKEMNVLLVDDVVTTGATIEACAQLLINSGCKVFVATIACA